MGSVMSQGRRAIMLGVLVIGLLAGLVGMHHLSVTPDAGSVAATAMSEPDTKPDPAHPGEQHGSSLLHLCLAVLTAVAVLLASAVLWGRPGRVLSTPRSRTSSSRTAPRAPPATAPARLALLCVMRT